MDMLSVREVLAYVRPMWLEPDIRRAWTDEGYETTTNILEGLWHHVDANMLNCVYNTHVHTSCAHRLPAPPWLRYNGASLPQFGIFEMGDMQFDDADACDVSLTSQNKRRRMNTIVAVLINESSQSSSSSLSVSVSNRSSDDGQIWLGG